MLYRDSPSLIANLITHLKKLIEEAQLLVVFRLMLNCLMRLHGKLKITCTPTLLELSTGTDIINQNHSTNLCSSTLTAEWRRRSKFMTFKIFLRKLIGIKVFKKELLKLAKAFMPQDKETSIKASLHSRYDILINLKTIYYHHFLTLQYFFFILIYNIYHIRSPKDNWAGFIITSYF